LTKDKLTAILTGYLCFNKGKNITSGKRSVGAGLKALKQEPMIPIDYKKIGVKRK